MHDEQIGGRRVKREKKIEIRLEIVFCLLSSLFFLLEYTCVSHLTFDNKKGIVKII